MADKNKNLVVRLIQDCIRSNMSKDEAARQLWKVHGVRPERTIQVWENLERQHQEYFKAYYAWLRQGNGESPPEVDSAMARRRPIQSGFGEQQQRRPTRRSLMKETAQNSQRHAAASSSSQVPQEAANANAISEADFRQQLMVMLAKIERNTDQMVQLMTNIHGCGRHRSAAGSLKRQQVEQTKESCDNEDTEKLQEKDRGDNEAAEKQSSCREGPLKRQRVEQTKESGENEKTENLQEEDRGDNEEAEKQREGSLKRQRIELTNVSGGNEKAEKQQEKERGDNEEAEKLQENERDENEEAEKLQEKERDENEEAEKLQEKKRCDNEEAEKLQEKESCANEEAEKLQDHNLQLPQ